jgi:hypothetical protein
MKMGPPGLRKKYMTDTDDARANNQSQLAGCELPMPGRTRCDARDRRARNRSSVLRRDYHRLMSERELPAGAVNEWQVCDAPIGSRFYQASITTEWFVPDHGGELEPGDVHLFRRLADAKAWVMLLQAEYPARLSEDGTIEVTEALIGRVVTVVDDSYSEGVGSVDDESFEPREFNQAVPAEMLSRSLELYAANSDSG